MVDRHMSMLEAAKKLGMLCTTTVQCVKAYRERGEAALEVRRRRFTTKLANGSMSADGNS
jgi:hypothetical protein